MSDAVIAQLRVENEILREDLRQLKEILGLRAPAPACLMLTQKEASVFNVLMHRPFITKAALMLAVYGYSDDRPSEKIIDVFICKLRRKLKPFGIEIETVWGQGFRISGISRTRAEKLIEEWAA